jgi:hypothetical protein
VALPTDVGIRGSMIMLGLWRRSRSRAWGMRRRRIASRYKFLFLVASVQGYRAH